MSDNRKYKGKYPTEDSKIKLELAPLSKFNKIQYSFTKKGLNKHKALPATKQQTRQSS